MPSAEHLRVHLNNHTDTQLVDSHTLEGDSLLQVGSHRLLRAVHTQLLQHMGC